MIERVDPLAVFGRPWPELTAAEQVELLGYATLREAEDAQEDKAMTTALRGKRGR